MAYQGNTITLPIGIQGFTGSKNPTQMQPGHLPYVEGLDVEAGVIQKEGGATKLNPDDNLNSRIRAGINWSATSQDHYDVVILENGDVLRDGGTGTFSTTLTDTLTLSDTPIPVFVPAGGEDVGSNRKLFLFTPDNQVQVVSGTSTSMAAISSPAADWTGSGGFPTFGVLHEGRLFAGGNSTDPHRIYYSEFDDHEDFTGAEAGTLAVFPGEGQTLVGGISFNGLLILFKYPVGIYVIETSGSPSDWRVKRLSGSVGAINHSSIVQIDNDVVYMDPGVNIHLLSATSEFGDVRSSNVSQIHDLGPFMRREVNFAEIQSAVGVYYAAKRQAWFAIPRSGSTVPDLRLVVDGNNLDIGPRFFLSRRDTISALWMRRDVNNIPRPTSGDDEGYIWLMDRDAREKDGEGYPLRLETADTDLAFVDPKLGFRSKNAGFLEAVIEPQGDWNLTVTVIWDDTVTQQLQFHMGIVGGVKLGDFELDEDILSHSAVRTDRQKLVGSGRKVRFVLENTGADQNVVVSHMNLAFTLGDERTEVT